MNGDRGMKGVRLTRDSPWQRLAFGLILLGVGVVFWLDQIGTIDARDYYVWWPLALIAMGVANLLERRWFAAAIWWVVGRVAPILGGYEDKTAGAPDGAPRLVIRGSAIMGGIEVRNAENVS